LKHLPADGMMLVDDAHGAGVLGETGKGSLEAEGASRQRIIQCITLSKAFGTYGGAVIATRELRKKILARSRLFVGSTPLPLPLANAALQAVRILKADKSLRRRLFQNTSYLKTVLSVAGLEIPGTPGPIVPLHFSNAAQASALKQRLLAAKIYPPFIQYPGGPAHGYFRFVISSEHTRAQLDALVEALTGA
jgi:7-keto-8-aminopelargonate synthetase-like enzyme